jgi:hypothetical protein
MTVPVIGVANAVEIPVRKSMAAKRDVTPAARERKGFGKCPEIEETDFIGILSEANS